MKKMNKIIYWISTLWLALGMFSTGLVQLLHDKSELDLMSQLGYPVYFLTMIGLWKILGVAAVLVPNFLLLKEWAYAGFFFAMTGAIYSHIAAGSTMNKIYPPLLLLILTIISWYSRPAARRMVHVNFTGILNDRREAAGSPEFPVNNFSK